MIESPGGHDEQQERQAARVAHGGPLPSTGVRRRRQYPRIYTKRVKPQDLVGTAEAAELLDVEAPRIGRWLQKGDMPMPVVWLAAGPVWRRVHIEAMRSTREERRRRPVGV
jgi:hypothetical protein